MAITVNKIVAKSIIGFNPISKRIIIIWMQAKPMCFTIIRVYSPTNQAEEEEIKDFYESLQDAVTETPKGGIIMIIGNLNTKVGNEIYETVGRRFGLGERNENGQRLVDICARNNMSTCNTPEDCTHGYHLMVNIVTT